jgi:crotonobetainyl-CoA:carnitine CoA-transferase CaiB-like acyl-CoA transferase
LALPLVGVTVVSFEQAVAGPFCSRNLADLGARVIKVEQPGIGDFTRQYDDAVRGLSSYFVWLNRNKESITLDLKHPRGPEVLTRLLAGADVVIQNLAPAAARRMGIRAVDVVARVPRAIAVDISGYGVGGPYDEKRAYDLLIQAEGGACSITGLPGSPAKAGPPIADLGTGLFSLSGVLAALFARERTGVGAAIHVSMFDVIAEFMGFALYFTGNTGEERQPNGMSTPMVAPYGAYPTSDGQTVVLGTTNDREWQRLATQLIERADLAADQRFATNAARCDQRAIIDTAIGEWTSRHALAEIQSAADAAGIGNARYNTVKDVLAHPQLQQRNRWRDVDSPVGAVASLRTPPVTEGWHDRLDPIPAVGEHTDRILGELGYSPDEIARLRAEGTI